MMTNCWEKKPEDRPTFTDLVAVLSLAMELRAGYVSISESGPIAQEDARYVLGPHHQS